jgi:hypothetical protein
MWRLQCEWTTGGICELSSCRKRPRQSPTLGDCPYLSVTSASTKEDSRIGKHYLLMPRGKPVGCRFLFWINAYAVLEITKRTYASADAAYNEDAAGQLCSLPGGDFGAAFLAGALWGGRDVAVELRGLGAAFFAGRLLGGDGSGAGGSSGASGAGGSSDGGSSDGVSSDGVSSDGSSAAAIVASLSVWVSVWVSAGAMSPSDGGSSGGSWAGCSGDAVAAGTGRGAQVCGAEVTCTGWSAELPRTLRATA